MQTITTIGLDIAKSVFQVHGVDAGDQVVIRYAKIHAPSIGLGSRHCWHASRPRWQRSRSPIKSREWSGP